ncbi:MAG: fatty acid desaturase [Acidobacteriota bacterium]|nr:fatty acid desaturase [Acidobacteriota bacterium]
MRNEATINFRRGGFNWGVTLFLLAVHVGAIVALFNFSWPALILAFFLWWVSGSLGIGIGYHRLLTHRGFKTPKWMEYFLTLCGTLAMEGSPIAWVVTHRIHHAYTDRDGDPHSPRQGFWWSHMGWIFTGYSTQRNQEATARYAQDLLKDPFQRWLMRWHYLTTVALGFVLFTLGGWQFVLWGIFLRIVLSWHTTWFVNSAAHVWGSRRFDTRDDSRNLWWVGLLAFGEGWHNNHHAHQSSARHGLTWYEIDFNWYGIWVMKKLSLAKDLRLTDWPKTSPKSSTFEAMEEIL